MLTKPTLDMSERHKNEAIPTKTLSRLTRSASVVEETGHADEKRATGTR